MGLNAAAEEDRVHVSWYPSIEPDVVEYAISRRSPEGSGVGPLAVGGLHTPAFTDTTVRPGVDYYYSVTALDGSGNPSSPSAEVTIRLSEEGFLPTIADFSLTTSVAPIGSGQKSHVQLGWQAAPGDRFASFAVDRSDDGGSIWTRRAAGTLSAKVGYEFEEDVNRGTYLYRIVAISTLGYELLLDPVTVRASGRPTRHQIDGPFPNPSSGPLQFTITLADDARVRILAYDLQGRLCGVLLDDQATAGVHPWSYDSRVIREGPLSSGVYFLRILVGDVQTIRKFVLEK
jgi:hypothetical protein